MTKDTGGPAFPQTGSSLQVKDGVYFLDKGGMTLRQYAAIKLKVPDSGLDWLDEMIRKSALNDFAAQAMQGFATDTSSDWENGRVGMAECAYKWAAAMLRECAK